MQPDKKHELNCKNFMKIHKNTSAKNRQKNKNNQPRPEKQYSYKKRVY